LENNNKIKKTVDINGFKKVKTKNNINLIFKHNLLKLNVKYSTQEYEITI
jgi:hypothetical protein